MKRIVRRLGIGFTTMIAVAVLGLSYCGTLSVTAGCVLSFPFLRGSPDTWAGVKQWPAYLGTDEFYCSEFRVRTCETPTKAVVQISGTDTSARMVYDKRSGKLLSDRATVPTGMAICEGDPITIAWPPCEPIEKVPCVWVSDGGPHVMPGRR